MATLTFARRLAVTGGFAIAVAAVPALAVLATPAGPALAECPSTEILDPASGACKPFSVQTPVTMNPIDPGITDLQPGEITSARPGDVGSLPEIDGIPCNGNNSELCIGLEQSQKDSGEAAIPTMPAGVQG